MLSCREATKIISESLDRKLPFWQRMGLWIHVAMCGLCRRFRRDLVHIHQETGQHADDFAEQAAESDNRLSDESRDQMKRLLDSET